MPMLIPVLRRLDGAATTAELRDRGIRGAQLTAAVHAGDVVRIRRGWYALHDTDPALRAAIRVGGRLACVSAAAHYGWATPARHGLHVAVAENASRLRPAPAEFALPEPVLHWGSDRPSNERQRLITDRFETVRHLVECLSPEHAVAALDSFLHDEPSLSGELEHWLSGLPAAVLARLPERNGLCHSFLETIGRIRLAAHGIEGCHQVEFPGIGRVDLVIDDRIVIEWDGGTHRTAEQQDADCRRDAYLTALGYRVLRFSYRLVMDEWFVVIAAIRAAIDRVERD